MTSTDITVEVIFLLVQIITSSFSSGIRPPNIEIHLQFHSGTRLLFILQSPRLGPIHVIRFDCKSYSIQAIEFKLNPIDFQ